jgi:hypothetical protein
MGFSLPGGREGAKVSNLVLLAIQATHSLRHPSQSRTCQGNERVSTFREHACGRRENVIPLIAYGRVVMEVLDREPFAIVEDVKMAIGLRKDFVEKAGTIAGLQKLYAIQIPPTKIPDLGFPVAIRILPIEDRRQVFREVFPQKVPEVLIRVNFLLDILFRFPLEFKDDTLFYLFFLLFKAVSHFLINRLVPAEQLFTEFMRHSVPDTEGVKKVSALAWCHLLRILKTDLFMKFQWTRTVHSLLQTVTGKVPDSRI